MLNQYCEGCHNDAERAGDLAFDRLDPSRLHADAAVWETVIRKLRGGLMPPPGEPRPDDERLAGFVGFLEESLDAAARNAPNPGVPSLRRLNRTEYANAVRDLIELPVDVAALLPGDDSVSGFDNIGSALSISPTLLQAYVGAAATLSRLAVGDPNASATLATYRAPRDWQSGSHVDGQPLGTRGGFQVEHVFPLDAEYEIRITSRSADDVDVTLDGKRVALLPSAGRNARVATLLAVPAGAHTLGVALMHRHDSEGVEDLFAVHAESSSIASFTVNGPLQPAGTGDTPSRRRIFSCSPALSRSEETACAAEILGGLATRAYRRPVAAGDAALAALIDFYAAGRADGSLTALVSSAPWRACSSIRSSSFVSSPSRTSYPLGPSTASATSISRRGYRFSSGAAFPTTRCSPRLPRASWASLQYLSREVQRMLAETRKPMRSLEELRQCSGYSYAYSTAGVAAGKQKKSSTAICARRCARKRRCCSRASRRARIAASSTCSTPTTRSSTSGSHSITACRTSAVSRFRRVELPPSSPRRGLLGQGSLLTLTSAPEPHVAREARAVGPEQSCSGRPRARSRQTMSRTEPRGDGACRRGHHDARAPRLQHQARTRVVRCVTRPDRSARVCAREL